MPKKIEKPRRIKVEKSYNHSGKYVYLHIENGKIRQKAILDCKHGIITLEELHKIARKHKYLLSTKVVEGVNYKKYELVKED